MKLITSLNPGYELIYGLTPANYSMPGSPGGLARIDNLFGTKGYTHTFSTAPVVFGAFPSLHAGWATLEALVISHFFPRLTKFAWAYAGILYWATMYLTHHYLVDVVGGACLATAFFYLFLPASLRDPAVASGTRAISIPKHEQYDLETGPPRSSSPGASSSRSRSSAESDTQYASYRSPKSAATPKSGAPLIPSSSKNKKRSHKHTASIANLIKTDEGAEGAWSPV